ncbi:MAG TPA: cytochrome c [Flavobacteriales bacterium]
MNRSILQRFRVLVCLGCAVIALALRSGADPQEGRSLYTAKCSRCHGDDGAKGKWGAKDLQLSRLSDAALADRIRKGGGIMPAFRKQLTDEQVFAIGAYVRSLRR